MHGKWVTLIVPCYNEEESLPIFFDAIRKEAANLPDYQFDFLFVDDGSKDRTLDLLKEMACHDTRVRFLSFSRNFGKEAAMYAGFVNSTGDFVAVMDADMQDPPSLLPEMLKVLEAGDFDSVATRRITRKGEPFIRSVFARMFYRIINRISDADVVDGARDFRLMRREMVEAIVSMCEYNRFSKGIFGWIGFKTKWLPYENIKRAAGETKWNFFSLFKYSIDGIVNFSQTPLSIASYTGILFTLIAFFMIVFVFVRRLLFGDPVAGWASTICIILFIGGIQLLCMGIMGQYLAKTYLEVKQRPHYIVAESNDEKAVRIH